MPPGLRFAGLALVLSGCLVRPPAEWKSPALAGQQWKLPNGLNVVAEQDSLAPTVSMALVIGAGAADDPPGKEGLAHLVDHLVFESRPQGRRKLSDVLDFEADAERANAVTEHDVTTFFADAPRESLPVLVDVARDIVSWPLANVDPEHLPSVLSRVRAELDEGSENTPAARIASWTREVAFPPAHPYRQPVRGSAFSLAGLSFEDALAFSRRFYRPNNATLVFTGGVDANQLGRLLASAFAHSPESSRLEAVRASRSGPPPAPPPEDGATRQADIHSPQLRILWTLPSDYGPGGGNMAVLVASLALQLARIQGEDPNIASLSVEDASGVRATTLAVVVGLNDATKVESTARFLIDRLPEIVERLSAGGWLFLAPNRYVEAASVLALESPGGRATALAKHAQIEGQPFSLQERIAEVALPDSVLLRQWLGLLTRERARVLYLEPLEGAGDPDGWLPPIDPTPERAPPEQLPPLSAVDLLGHLPDLSGARGRLLANGLAVEVVPIRGAPLTTAMLLLPGGVSVAPAGAASMLEFWGLDPHADHLEAFGEGGFFAGSFSRDRLSVSLRGEPQNVHRMIDWLGNWVRERRVPDQKWIQEFDRVHQPIAEVRALAMHKQALYPGSAWGAQVTAAQLGALDTSALRRWAEQVITPSGAVLVVVGDVDPAATLARVEKAFGEWSGEPRPAPPSSAPPAAHAPTVSIQPVPGAQLAKGVFSCRLPAATTPRQAVVAALAAGSLREALYRSWRTQRGTVLGVGAAHRLYWGGAAHFSLQFALPNERLGGTLSQLHAPAVEERDLDRAKQDWVRTRDLAFLTSQGAAVEIAGQRLLGGSLPELANQGVIVADISLAEIEGALRTCQGTQVLLVTGDEAPVQAALSSAGWAAGATEDKR